MSIPREFAWLMASSLQWALRFKEGKHWFNLGAFAVALIGIAQIALGAFLIWVSAGALTTVGTALIAEGVGDIMYAVQSGLSGSFSWRGYLQHKVVSLSLTVLTFGIGSFGTQMGQQAVKTGTQLTVKVGKKIAEGVFWGLLNTAIEKAIEEARKNAVSQP